MLPKAVGRLTSTREYKLCSHRNLLNLLIRNLGKEDLLQMITVDIQTVYYALGIASILCGAAYKLGYEIGKNARK